MRLVPRQLQRAGMTGSVPYYGGRLTPAHAYAVTHPPQPPPASGSSARAAGELTDKLATLQQLLDDGLLSDEEYDMLRRRVLQ